MFFETIYPELAGLSGEVQVCCPFPHHKADGTTYYDHTPSMCINLDKRVYRCCSCGASGNEVKMVSELYGVDSRKANNLVTMLKYGVDKASYFNSYEAELASLSEEDKNYYDKVVDEFGLDKDELSKNMVIIKDHEWITPVLWHDHVVDIRTYTPGGKIKVKSESGAPSGLLIPRDYIDWERTIFLCAGEKDMWVARSRGLNAATFTGGEMNTTFFDLDDFKGKQVVVLYDNDQAGRVGGIKISTILSQHGANVYNCTKFHDDFPEDDSKEDITDWFCTYGHTVDELKEYVKNTPRFSLDTAEVIEEYPTLSLYDGIDVGMDGKKFHCTVQILTTSDDTFQVADNIKITKCTSDSGEWSQGENRIYNVLEKPQYCFSMVGISEQRQVEILRKVECNNEKGLVGKIIKFNACVVCQVADTNPDFNQRREMPVVCLNWVPAQGKLYNMTLIRTHNIYDGTIGAICIDYEEIDSSITVDVQEAMPDLLTVQRVQGSVKQRVEDRAKRVQGIVGYEAPLQMIIAQDLTLNSVKAFNLLNGKNIRGYLDTLVVGESRVGKSDVAQHLRNTYALGEFVSLAGSAATLPGIIGGSVRDSMGKLSTRCGVLPRNNNGAVIFEELSKAPEDILRSLTDVRSSGKARITRVSGSYEMPASARMLTLSNAKPGEDGTTRALDNYANGIDILQELIGTSEDIARYDLTCLVGNPEHIDPAFNAAEPYEDETYQNCIKFIWQLEPEDIEFVDGADELVAKLNEDFNHQHPINIKLMGPEGWKKLGRVSCAVAAYIMNTDKHFSKLLVTPEIVQYAYDFICECYNSELFRLQDFSDLYVAKHVATKRDVDVLQECYTSHTNGIVMLNRLRKLGSSQLNTMLAGDDRENRAIMSKLMAQFLIEQVGREFRVTSKWNAAFAKLKRMRVNEVDTPID